MSLPLHIDNAALPPEAAVVDLAGWWGPWLHLRGLESVESSMEKRNPAIPEIELSVMHGSKVLRRLGMAVSGGCVMGSIWRSFCVGRLWTGGCINRQIHRIWVDTTVNVVGSGPELFGNGAVSQ